MATGFVFHELYLWHNTWNYSGIFAPSLTVQPGEHNENPETKRRMRNLIEVSGLLDQLVQLKPRYATDDEVARFHTRAHIAKIKAISETGYGEASARSPPWARAVTRSRCSPQVAQSSPPMPSCRAM